MNAAHHVPQLHAHLTGSISRTCLHDIWNQKRAQGAALDLEDPLVAIAPGGDYDIKTYAALPLDPLFAFQLVTRV